MPAPDLSEDEGPGAGPWPLVAAVAVVALGLAIIAAAVLGLRADGEAPAVAVSKPDQIRLPESACAAFARRFAVAEPVERERLAPRLRAVCPSG